MNYLVMSFRIEIRIWRSDKAWSV